MLNCRDVVADADRLLEGEMSWRERMAIKFHLLMCRHCRRYIRQLKRLIAAVPGMHSKASEEEVLNIMARIDAEKN